MGLFLSQEVAPRDQCGSAVVPLDSMRRSILPRLVPVACTSESLDPPHHEGGRFLYVCSSWLHWQSPVVCTGAPTCVRSVPSSLRQRTHMWPLMSQQTAPAVLYGRTGVLVGRTSGPILVRRRSSELPQWNQ